MIKLCAAIPGVLLLEAFLSVSLSGPELGAADCVQVLRAQFAAWVSYLSLLCQQQFAELSLQGYVEMSQYQAGRVESSGLCGVCTSQVINATFLVSLGVKHVSYALSHVHAIHFCA